MAELLAIGKDLKGLTTATTLNADGSATIKLNGSENYRPELRLTAAEAAALRSALTPQPKPPASLFAPGLVLNPIEGSLVKQIQASLGATACPCRSEFAIGEGTAALAAMFVAFPTLQPLAGFEGRIPTATEAQGLVAWAKACPKLKKIEFGNETSYSYQFSDNSNAAVALRAAEYAVEAREAALALRPFGVGLIVQAEDGGSGSSLWVDSMFRAVPDLASYAAGWSIHPYGVWGLEKMERMVRYLATHGETKLPIHATEWGIACDQDSSGKGRALSQNWGLRANLNYAEAGLEVAELIPKLRAAAGGRLASLFVYQTHDGKPSGASTERDAYLGATTVTGGPKGAYTDAIKSLMASR